MVNDTDDVIEIDYLDEEEKRKLIESREKARKLILSDLNDYLQRTVNDDGSIEEIFYEDSNHLACKKEDAFFIVTRLINKNKEVSIKVEEYINQDKKR